MTCSQLQPIATAVPTVGRAPPGRQCNLRRRTTPPEAVRRPLHLQFFRWMIAKARDSLSSPRARGDRLMGFPRGWLLPCTVLIAAMLQPAGVKAQANFPTKPITLLVPAAAGGPTD